MSENATTQTSPRPWRVIDKPNGQLVLYTSIIECCDGRKVAFVCRSADAALIVDAVNNEDSWRRGYIKARTERNAFLLERDRLRDIVRKTLDAIDALYTVAAPGAIVKGLTPDRTCLGVPIGKIVAEARAAIGEEEE